MKRQPILAGLLLLCPVVWLHALDGCPAKRHGVSGARPLGSPVEPRNTPAPRPADLQPPVRWRSVDARLPHPVPHGPTEATLPLSIQVQEPTRTDPCADLRAECERLTDQVAYLRDQLLLVQAHDGLTPFEHFLRSPDADLIPGEEDRRWLKAFMGLECPFYLQPGEALEVLRIERGEVVAFGSSTEQLVRFLGPQRVLREAPSEWLAQTRAYLGDGEWELIFGTPPP